MHASETDPPFPTQSTLAVLNVTTMILENCTNKHLYQSYEYLTDLLAAPDSEVLICTLQALVAFLKKTHHSSVRFHGYPALNTRLFDLCRGWGGTEQGLDMAVCVQEDEAPIQEFINKGTTLHFEFYNDNPHMANQENSGLRIIHEDDLNLHYRGLSEHRILEELVKQFTVPIGQRFRLLNCIRIARGFESLEGRRALVKIRLLAFSVLFQSNPLHDDMLSFFMSEPEFMNELVGLVQGDAGVSLELRTLALRALTVQLVDRSRHTAVVNAIGVGGQNGVLSILLQDSVDYICNQENSPSSSSQRSTKYNSQFVEALLVLVAALISSSAGSVALSESGLIPALLPLLRDRNLTHSGLVCSAVKILEGFMAFSSTASALLRGLGGLSDMIKRLEVEVQWGTSTAESTGDGSSSTHQEAKRIKASDEDLKQVPYGRRLLLKSLLRAIALASYAPSVGNGIRPEEQDARVLYRCLKSIFNRAKEFGGALFAFAASVATDLIHHDPFCFNALDEEGVPDAFLDAILIEGVVPSSEAVCGIPPTLVAFCLTENGLTKVKDRHALSCMTVIFTSKKYLRALSGDTASILGAGTDELFRHVRPLKEEGIQHVIVQTLKALCLLGGDPELLEEYKTTQLSVEPDQTDDVEMTDVEETLSSTPDAMEVMDDEQDSTPVAIEMPAEVLERAKETGIDSTLPECISHAAKMLESLLSSADTSQKFVQCRGVEYLLRLYTLPRIPPAFGSSSQSHSLLSIFRLLSHEHYQCLSLNVPLALSGQLEATTIEAEKLHRVCVPAMDTERRDSYIRLIASTSGLTSVAGTIARTSNPMLTELCKGDRNLISLLGNLERLVLHQLSYSDIWKEKKSRLRKEIETNPETLQTTGTEGTAEESEAERTDLEMSAMEVDSEFVGGNEQSANQNWQNEIEMQNLANGKYSRRKSPDDLAFDVLQHFVVTVRGLYTAIAKSIHTPARRREESFAQPSLTMKAAALGLALVLKNNLEFEIADLKEPGMYRYIKHQSRLIEEIQTVLFDNRRQCCHTLILNYFVAVQGMASLVHTFSNVVDLLWSLVHETNDQPSSSSVAGNTGEISRNESKQAVENLLLAYLGLFTQLTSPRLLCQSAPTASLLVVPLPSKEPTGAEQDEEQSSKSKEFIKKLQESILGAVLPVWSSPYIAKTAPAITSNVIGILNSCLDGETNLSAAFRAIRSDGGATGNHWRQPDPSIVQQIIDMGFTRARAMQALRRNVLNSVEAALDWLVNHPEEETAQSGGTEGETRGENEELAAAMAASLDQIGEGGGGGGASSSSNEAVQNQKTDSLQCLDLVIGAVSVLERMPVAAFSVSSLLMTLCNRNEGIDRRSVIQWFVQHLNESLNFIITHQKERNYSGMNATAHLLALMMSESQPCRQVAVELKIADDLVKMLDQWEEQYTGMNEIPVFIEGVLLVLDFLAQTHQPPNPENPVSSQTAESEAQSDGESMETELSDKLLKIMDVWTPSGSITEIHRLHLMEFCIKLLKHLHVYGKDWTPPTEGSENTVNHLSTTDPAGVTQAVLQLLASITRCHQTASKFLHQGGVDLILMLPASCILPRHESYISTILMHILEDESTLLSLMETEIKHVFSTQRRPVEQIPLFEWEQMRIGSFMQKTSSLAYRSPKIFAKAVAGLCTIGPSGTGTGNQVIYLKRSKNHLKSSTTPGTASNEKVSGSTSESKGKGNKRVVLMSFVDVIDKLLDHIMTFDLTVNSMVTDKDQDFGASGKRPVFTAEASDTSVHVNGREEWEALERMFETAYRSGQTEEPNAMRPASESFAGPLSRQSIMNNRDLIMQIMVLRMLSDFCLLYSSTIGVLLKRDAELSQKDPPILTEMHSSLLKRVLHGHLSWSLKSDLIKPNLSEEASRFLQAVCVRSSEGRRRVLTEIVSVLNWATAMSGKAPKQTNLGLPFVSVIGNLLTSGSPSKPNNQNGGGAGANQNPPPTTGLTVELIRTMRSVGMVTSLTKSIDLIDIHHPDSPKAINSIIKALEILTRVIPLANPKKIGSGGGSGGTRITPDRERSNEGRDVDMVVSSSPPPSSSMTQNRHIQTTDLMDEDLHEIQDAAQLFYEALENINEMDEGSSEDIMQSNEGDPMDASEDDEDEESESGSSDSSSESNSFHEDASHEEHVVVDEESEDIEDEHEALEGSGDEEDLDEEDEDMEEGEEDEDGSADMELEDGEDWEDDEAMREYTETLDRIDSVVWGASDDPPELLNTLNESGIVFSRNERGVPPHIRSVLENMLGNFVGTREENRQDRRGGIRFRLLPRDQGQTANAPPPYRVQPLGAAEHRLLARPVNEGTGPQTGPSARTMAEGFGRRYGQVVGTGGNWRRHVGYSGLPAEMLRNPLGEGVANPGLYFFTADGTGGIHPHHHGVGGNEVTNAFGERRGRENNQQSGPDIGSSWMNSMQGQFEDLLVHTLPRENPVEQQQQPETSTPVEGAPPPPPVEEQNTGEAPVVESIQQGDQETPARQLAEPQQLPEEPVPPLQQQAEAPEDQDEDEEDEDDDDDEISEDSEDGEAMEEDTVPVVDQEQEQEQEQDQEQDQNEEQEQEQEEVLPAEILRCAEQAGIDPAFLQALPRPLQIEVLSEHRVSISQLVASDQQQQQQQQQGQQGGGGGEGVDPEFLAALPPDIREEVLESQRLEERRREVERRLAEGHGDDVANVIASLPDDIREEVLLYGGPDILYNLPPNLLAEGQRMRERIVRHQHRDNIDEQMSPNLFIRRLRQEAGLHRDGPAGANRLRGKKDKKEEMEIPPAVDVHGLTSLVGLLRLNQPIVKGQLQRLFLNLCYREDNRKEITQLLLQKLKESDQCTTSVSSNAPSPSVTRRVLDLLSYLARYPASKVAEMMLELRIKLSSSELDRNGKLPLHEAQLNPRALEILIEMLNQPLCLRSVSTLEQGLLLMEAILQCASLKKKELENDEEKEGGTSSKTEDIESVQSLSFEQLKSLPGILARDGLSERAYKKTDSVISLLVETAPKHLISMLIALNTQIKDLMQSACSTLFQISSNGVDRSSIYSLGGIGALVLRVLRTVESLVEITTEEEEEGAQEVLRNLSSSLDVLWKALSPLISDIELQILNTGKSSVARMEADASSKVLPSGASQTLPFVESFFVLCSVMKFLTKTSHHDEENLTTRQSGSDLGLASPSTDFPQSSMAQESAPNDSMLQEFVEKHRLLLNAFIRQTPALLEGSFKPLIQTPRLIDFDNKRLYFRSNVRVDDRLHYGTLRINVRREQVFEDSFHQLRHRSSDELRWKLSVQFASEEGIDAGGVAREWYQVMSKEIFNPNLALFIAVPDGASTFQPNPNSIIQNDRGMNHLDFFRFVGRLVGKALYDGQLVDAHFTRSFYKHMLNQPLTYQDLEAVDLDFYKQMKWILENDITEVLMGQTFSAEVDFFGRKEIVELKESGSKINITESNKKEYVNLMTKHKMTTAIRDQIKAFQEGFWELIPIELINIFNDHELELIISGLPEVDISDLKANTEYTGYTAASPVIQWFWQVIEELDKESLALLLQFVTGTSKIPLDGFAHLQGISGPQKFQIHKSYVSTNRLPSAHTCFNQLDLPEYESKDQLKSRLLLAVHEGCEGFGFG
eukprot:g4879.t1